MRNQAVDEMSTYLSKNETELWRDEKAVSFQVGKIKCRSVWDEKGCAKDWVNIEKFLLAEFDYSRTRHLMLSTDPSLPMNQREMYEYFKEHRVVSGLIRNLERGKKKKVGPTWVWEYKPINITNYRWYLEWYISGYFHVHLFIEVAKMGYQGMIGQERIHHYWKLGQYIREGPIKDKRHWFNLMGDFQKAGYFQQDKNHQSRLPDWALDIPGYKIRRSSGKRKPASDWRDPWDEYCRKASQEKIDLATGEVLANFKFPRGKSNKTYRERHEGCGQKTYIKMSTDHSVIEGVFNVPWKDIIRAHDGSFHKGLGYVFHSSVNKVFEVLGKSERITKLTELNPVTWEYERVGFLKWAWCLRPGITRNAIQGLYYGKIQRCERRSKMLEKSDVFYYVCTKCGRNLGFAYDQAKMTEEESRKSQRGDYTPKCPACGDYATVECW